MPYDLPIIARIHRVIALDVQEKLICDAFSASFFSKRDVVFNVDISIDYRDIVFPGGVLKSPIVRYYH